MERDSNAKYLSSSASADGRYLGRLASFAGTLRQMFKVHHNFICESLGNGHQLRWRTDGNASSFVSLMFLINRVGSVCPNIEGMGNRETVTSSTQPQSVGQGQPRRSLTLPMDTSNLKSVMA